jgi:hypothetical protein
VANTTGLSLEMLVDHMFDQVLEAPERSALIRWILEWEAAHPDVDNAHRITGWIDVAYVFQARADRESRARDSTPVSPWNVAVGAAFA